MVSLGTVTGNDGDVGVEVSVQRVSVTIGADAVALTPLGARTLARMLTEAAKDADRHDPR